MENGWQLEAIMLYCTIDLFNKLKIVYKLDYLPELLPIGGIFDTY